MSKELLIAVVDDDEPFRMAVVDWLSSFGYAARGFASAEEFIGSEANTSCDCVITDIHMSGMNGFELGRLLTTRSAEVPVIMVTARADADLDGRAAASGAVGLLRKPFKTDDLIDFIERALKA